MKIGILAPDLDLLVEQNACVARSLGKKIAEARHAIVFLLPNSPIVAEVLLGLRQVVRYSKQAGVSCGSVSDCDVIISMGGPSRTKIETEAYLMGKPIIVFGATNLLENTTQFSGADALQFGYHAGTPEAAIKIAEDLV